MNVRVFSLLFTDIFNGTESENRETLLACSVKIRMCWDFLKQKDKQIELKKTKQKNKLFATRDEEYHVTIFPRIVDF